MKPFQQQMNKKYIAQENNSISHHQSQIHFKLFFAVPQSTDVQLLQILLLQILQIYTMLIHSIFHMNILFSQLHGCVHTIKHSYPKVAHKNGLPS